MRYGWKPEKNQKLKAKRGVSFEDILDAYLAGGFCGAFHYNGHQKIHKNHMIIVVGVDKKMWGVAAVVTAKLIFFRTAYEIEKE
ncbi:hypothetical protein WDW37_16270 [Bdellovibrionota bacterium FG-1]